MIMPAIQDDGERVTLDLHGARVDEAVQLAHKVLRLATTYGRTSLKLIHGSSTTQADTGRETIKTALAAALNSGVWRIDASKVFRSTDYMILSLPLGNPRNGRRISMLDL